MPYIRLVQAHGCRYVRIDFKACIVCHYLAACFHDDFALWRKTRQKALLEKPDLVFLQPKVVMSSKVLPVSTAQAT